MILRQKYDVVIEEKGLKETTHEELIQYCKDLLPIIVDLDGELAVGKGKVALKLAQAQLELFKNKFKEGILTKEQLLREIKPYLMLQVEAKRLIF